ncbi:MAG: YebC/PmpR family DNA-binding transcriptional regulator [Candidatus Wildermuthbacteria bacterium]|nr:YebC/PmpR family DNA-binding transcriptional regulator [Candidatus Wildermuthbacteria bacterium]
MSGHSHAKKIMHEKGAADSKRSKVFSKLAKELTIAARESGGSDPMTNPRLRTVMEKAKAANMPADNVERAVKKAAGGDASQLEEIFIEAYGPEGIALLISAIGDNRNRIIGEIKQVLQKNQGKMVEGGAVRWLFERRGVITIEAQGDIPLPKEELELLAIEFGAEDFYWHDHALDLYANPSTLASLKDKLQEKGFSVVSSLDWVPKERIQVTPEGRAAAERLFEALRDHDDVQDIYSNL